MSHTADARRRANLDAERANRCPGGGRTSIEVDDPNTVQPKKGRGRGHIGTVTCPDCLRGLRATASPRRIAQRNDDGQTLWFTTYTATVPHHKPA